MKYPFFYSGKFPRNKIGHPCSHSQNNRSAAITTLMTLSMGFSRRSLRFTVKTAIFSQGLPQRRESSIALILTSMIQPSISPLFHSIHQIQVTTGGPQPPRAILKRTIILSPTISEGLSKLYSTLARLKNLSCRVGR